MRRELCVLLFALVAPAGARRRAEAELNPKRSSYPVVSAEAAGTGVLQPVPTGEPFLKKRRRQRRPHSGPGLGVQVSGAGVPDAKSEGVQVSLPNDPQVSGAAVPDAKSEDEAAGAVKPVEASKEEAPKEEAPKEEAPKEEAPKEEAPKVEASKEETPKEETPKEETSEEETSEGATSEDEAEEEDKKVPGELVDPGMGAMFAKKKPSNGLKQDIKRCRAHLEKLLGNPDKVLLSKVNGFTQQLTGAVSDLAGSVSPDVGAAIAKSVSEADTLLTMARQAVEDQSMTEVEAAAQKIKQLLADLDALAEDATLCSRYADLYRTPLVPKTA